MAREQIKIVSLSKGRAGNITTHKVIDDIIVVCPANEVDLYRDLNPDLEIVSEPKDCRGITQARQFVLDQFDDVFMVDDDIEYVRNFFNGEGEDYKVTNKQHVRDIIEQTRSIAEQMGAKMFGYTHRRRPVAYYPQQPFRTTGFLNGSHCGFLKGHNLEYDTNMIEGEDYYMSCLNVFKNRFMIIDDRYGFMTTDNFANSGGCSGDRNTQIMQDDTLYLREHFGDVVKMKKWSTHKKNVREGERTIQFPF